MKNIRQLKNNIIQSKKLKIKIWEIKETKEVKLPIFSLNHNVCRNKYQYK